MFNDFRDMEKRLDELDEFVLDATSKTAISHKAKMRILKNYARIITAREAGKNWASLIDNIDCKAADYDADYIIGIVYCSDLKWPNGDPVDESEADISVGIENAVLFVELMASVLEV